MNIEYIRTTYGVPAKRGARVKYTDSYGTVHDGVIVGSRGPYIRVRIETLDGGGVHSLHPTWNLEYEEV